jgi:hypothetical protein
MSIRRASEMRRAMKDGHSPSHASRIVNEMSRQEAAEGGVVDNQPTDQPDFGGTGSAYESKQERPETAMAAGGGVLSSAARKHLSPKSFAVPSKAPGSGSFPIPNASHARNALARASGKPVEGQVRAAVKRKFPGIGGK